MAYTDKNKLRVVYGDYTLGVHGEGFDYIFSYSQGGIESIDVYKRQMYTLNYRCHCEHIPVIIPMYYYYPFEEKAYSYKNQYFLGSEMLVCPRCV